MINEAKIAEVKKKAPGVSVTIAFARAAVNEANKQAGAMIWNVDDLSQDTALSICETCNFFAKIAGSLITGREEEAGEALHERLTGIGQGFYASMRGWDGNEANLSRLAHWVARKYLPGDFLIANEFDALIFRPRDWMTGK